MMLNGQYCGFKKCGENVFISDKISIYNAKGITIGDNVRIDDFCILSAGAGGIEIGSNIHISCYCSFIGAGKITLEDYTNFSPYVNIMSSSDDFSGEYLISPVIPIEKRNVKNLPVTIKKFAVLGIKSIVLPGITMGVNSGAGAMTLIRKDIADNELWGGNPAKLIYMRKQLNPSIDV